MRGGLPSSTSSGMSTASAPKQLVAHAPAVVRRWRCRPRQRAALALAQRLRRPDCPDEWPAHSAPAIHCTRFASATCPDSSSGTARRSISAATIGRRESARQGVGQAASANVVNRQNRVGFAQLPAAVDDFLAAAFDFRVATLHRVEIQVFGIGARGPSTTQRRRPGRSTGRGRPAGSAAPSGSSPFVDLAALDIAQAASDHDRFVIAAHLAVHFGFKGAEVAARLGRPNSLLNAAPPAIA